jgi:hypothetical protein
MLTRHDDQRTPRKRTLSLAINRWQSNRPCVVARSRRIGGLGPFMKRLYPQAISLSTNRRTHGQINRSSNEHHFSAMHFFVANPPSTIVTSTVECSAM